MVVENLLLLAAVIPSMALGLFLLFQLFRLFFSYKITDKDITILLFHFLPIYRIPFEKIVEIHSAPFHEVALVPGMHLFTRVFARRVVIEMKNKWFVFAFLTPENPDAFIAEVKNVQRLKNKKTFDRWT